MANIQKYIIIYNIKIYNALVYFKEFRYFMKKLEQLPDKRLKAIGSKLRQIRIEKGYGSYDFFAWENKLSRIQYLNMEQGKNFTLKSLLKVLDIHGMTLSDFFEKL